MAVLGCGDYEALVLPRGGGPAVVKELPWADLDWGRVLDDTSSASVTVTKGEGCPDELRLVRTWEHELAVFRSGALVWVGPIWQLEDQEETYKISARDLSAWLDHRWLLRDHYTDQTEGDDLADVLRSYFDDAIGQEPSPNVTLQAVRTGIRTIRQVLAAEHALAGGPFREVANIGVNWTTLLRQVQAGPVVTVDSGRVAGVLADDHFTAQPRVLDDGSQKANHIGVAGAGTGFSGDEIFGEATNPASRQRDGLLYAKVSVSTIQDSASATTEARHRVAVTDDPLLVDNAILDPKAPVTVPQLVPGNLFELGLEQPMIQVLGQVMCLQQVAARISGTDAVEQITLTFGPVPDLAATVTA